VGSPGYITRTGVELDAQTLVAIERHGSVGRTPVLVTVDDCVRGVAAFGDPVRADARACLTALRDLGYELAILSGDHPRVVQAVADELAIPFASVLGGATPETKLAFIEARRASGPVLMVGDGVNDAAALSAASVGIAVHGGAEASLNAADVFLTRSGLMPLVELVAGARRTLGVIRRSIGFSLVYNLVGVGLAMSGALNPLIAAVMMPLSSLTVLTSSLVSRTFRKPNAPAPSVEAPPLAVAEVTP
jgi:Cu2+-exporting ATPase